VVKQLKVVVENDTARIIPSAILNGKIFNWPELLLPQKIIGLKMLIAVANFIEAVAVFGCYKAF
jgi:hypothetical protein